MQRRRLLPAGFALLSGLGAPAGPALGQPSAAAASAAPANAAPATTRAAVEGELAELESRTAHGEPLAEPLGRARKALSRAKAMELSGDKAHAGQAVAAARQWIQVARDVIRLRHAEARALSAEKQHEEALTRLKRSRTLLEESVARRGRAAAVLTELETRPTPAPPAPQAPAGKAPR